MNISSLKSDEKNNTYLVVFSGTEDDTCLKKWSFEIEKNDNKKIINDIQIAFTNKGCKGHPQTISALVKGRALDDIDVEALLQTSCFRSQSCGKSLGLCIQKLAADF